MNEYGEFAPWWLGGSAVAGVVVMKAVDWLFARRKERTETDVNVDLLEQLRQGLVSQGERIKLMEDAQAAMRLRLDEEIKLRMATQEEAHLLRMRVQLLESTLRQLGAVIPQEHA